MSPARWSRLFLIGFDAAAGVHQALWRSVDGVVWREVRWLWRSVAFFFAWYFCLNIYLNFSSGYFINEIKNNILPSWLAFVFMAIYIRREQDYLLLLRALVVAMLVVVCVAN